MRDGKFDSRLARVYYLIGVLYYLYKLVLVVGGVGIIGSVVSLRGFRFANETLIASIFILIWGINLRFKVSKIQRHSANPGLHIMTEECVYSVLGGGRFRYTKRLRLKALREGVDHYDHKFIWTGRGTINISMQEMVAGVAVDKIIVSDEPFGPNKSCRVTFERPLRRKEIAEFSYTMELVDEERAARPYLAQKIKVPIDTLILRVRFPAGENPGECLKLIYESHGATIPLLEEKAHLSIDVDEVRWDIPHPRISRYYQIRW